MARVVSFPRPTPADFPDGLPGPSEPHHCPAFTTPVAVYVDRAGLAWTEHECQVCGASFDVPADLDGLARLVSAPRRHRLRTRLRPPALAWGWSR